jgi:porphobilinogen synthase
MLNRTRRLRKSEGIRRLVRENQLTVDDLIYPLFVEEGENIEKDIVSMPGIKRFSLDRLSSELDEVVSLNIPAVLLFGIPSSKDGEGSETWNDQGILQRAIRFVKKHHPNLYVITDVCFCEYTDHGHCGVLHNNDVDNDATLVNIAKQVISHAKAGADMVAPSGMMDGTIQAMREALDATGFYDLPIMGYSVKYASAFYGPFREAAFDDQEGADILMVKPALSYLDVIRDLKNTYDRPIACYNVSGEYAMIKAAAAKGWIDGERVMMESLLSMKRAGADIIITYFAKEVARVLLKNK